jgi:hypothetical protein
MHLCSSSPHCAAPSQEFLTLGYSLLLSDVDILTLKNPFDHLYRDEDVEALSDGFDPPTAYGEHARWYSYSSDAGLRAVPQSAVHCRVVGTGD